MSLRPVSARGDEYYTPDYVVSILIPILKRNKIRTVWCPFDKEYMNGQYVYLSGVELAVWFKPKGRKVFNAHCKNTVFKYSNGSRKIHPTQKNVNLFEELITDNTNENEIVFDPFMGSGTTAIACLNTDRQYIGFELDREYYEAATRRVSNHKDDIAEK